MNIGTELRFRTRVFMVLSLVVAFSGQPILRLGPDEFGSPDTVSAEGFRVRHYSIKIDISLSNDEPLVGLCVPLVFTDDSV